MTVDAQTDRANADAALPTPQEELPPRSWRAAAALTLFAIAYALFVAACQPASDLGTSLCTIFCEKFDYPLPPPAHAPNSWLTRAPIVGGPPPAGQSAAGVGDAYYAAIDPTQSKDTFEKWKTANGFPTDEVVTYYYNSGDLDFGREMHCRQLIVLTNNATFTRGTTSTACYVTNYAAGALATDVILNPAVSGPIAAVEADVKHALDRAIAHDAAQAFATVAMESSFVRDIGPGIDNIVTKQVNFYVFLQPSGARQPVAVLDSEGPKSLPVMCMACHGGTYNYTTHQVTDASFLPFDLHSFRYSTTTGFTRQDQEENFRRQNQFVRNARTTSEGIVRLINLEYPRNVETAGTTAVDDALPAGWVGKGHDDLYLYVVRQYCRSCHIAQTPYRPDLEFNDYAQFEALAALIAADACGAHSMPQAEIPFYKFWQLNAVQRGPEILQKWLQSQNSNCAVPTPPPSATP